MEFTGQTASENYGWGEGKPILFETMVFEGSSGGEQDRYSTWDEAEAGHVAMVLKIFQCAGVLVVWNDKIIER